MRSYRTRNLLVAGALAGIAAILTTISVAHAGSKAKTAPSAGPLATVLVATADIAAGTPGPAAAAHVAPATVAASTAAPDAVKSRSQLEGLVTVQPLYKGEQVSLRRFGTLKEQGVLADLSRTMRAMQVSGDANQVLAGTLRQGDHVDVIANLKPGTTSQTPYVRTILRNVLVLQAPESGGSGSAAPQSYAAVLRLTDAQARRLYFVFENGNWALVLRPVVHASDSADATESFRTVLGSGR